ncbi:MAG: hypothetical protein ABI851_16175 [Saprospiraceae bacterium]
MKNIFILIIIGMLLIQSCAKQESLTKLIDVPISSSNPMMLSLPFVEDSNPTDTTVINTWVNHINPVTISNTTQLEILRGILINTYDTLELIARLPVSEGNSSTPRFMVPRRGWRFDGNDCFIYGSYEDNNNGTWTFTPASYPTQSTMNRCGYANVAISNNFKF